MFRLRGVGSLEGELRKVDPRLSCDTARGFVLVRGVGVADPIDDTLGEESLVVVRLGEVIVERPEMDVARWIARRCVEEEETVRVEPRGK